MHVNISMVLFVLFLHVKEVKNANFASIQSNLLMGSKSPFLEITSFSTWGAPFCSAQCAVNENCSAYAIVKASNSDQTKCILLEKTDVENNNNDLCTNCQIYELGSPREHSTSPQSTTTETMSTSTAPSTTTTSLPGTTTTEKICNLSCVASALYMRKDDNGFFACTFCSDKKLYLTKKDDNGWCTPFHSTPVTQFYQGFSKTATVKAAVQILPELTLLIDNAGVWYFFKLPPSLGSKVTHLAKATDHCMPQQMKNLIVEFALQVTTDYFLFMEINKNFKCIKDTEFLCNKTGGLPGKQTGKNNNDKKSGIFGGFPKGKNSTKSGNKKDSVDKKGSGEQQGGNSQEENPEAQGNETLDHCNSVGEFLKEISSIAIDQIDEEFYEIKDNAVRMFQWGDPARV